MADAMRYLAVSLPKTTDGLSSKQLDKFYEEAHYGAESQLPDIFKDNIYVGNY
jgi:hypothetical protein